MRTILTCSLLLVLASPVSAAEWEPVTAELLKKEKPGYGGLCGVVVDRGMSGDVYVNVSDLGIFFSQDQGKTWNRPAGITPFKGRTETPGCMTFDPVEKSRRLLVALVYGAPAGIYGAGPEHRIFDKKCSHIDWAAVDWTDRGGKFVLALKHESGGLLLVSHDGGKTFEDVGKGFGPAWVFDDQTAVAAEMKSKEKPKPGLLRTTDAGKTWKPCGDYATQALPKWFDGKLYWLVDGALVTTTDRGENWKKVCDVKDGRYGPIFGKTAKHLFVLTQAGVIESADGGETWTKPLPVPKEMKGVSSLTWLDYDPMNDVLYVMKMGSELYKMARK